MYQWDARTYCHNSANQERWARELLEKLGLRGRERVLDLGCGDGKVTARIAELAPGGSVLGIDSSEPMIGFARQAFPVQGHPNLAFEVGDMRELRYRGEFDVVFSNAALHWVRDHTPVIAGIRRALRPGGRILLQMGGEGNAAGFFEAVDQIIRAPEWRGYFANFEFPYGFFSAGQYREWLTQAGFTVDRAELIPKDMVHEGKAGLAGWVATTWLPYTQRVPEPKRERLISELCDLYLAAHPADGDGKVHLAMVRLEVEAHLGR